LTVPVVARHAHQAAAARTFGATTAVQAEGAEAVWLIRDLTHGVGADLVVEAVGRHPEPLELAWQLVLRAASQYSAFFRNLCC
jgi:threonine dehydrogenase-like Zn-dependent dehydrogenase